MSDMKRTLLLSAACLAATLFTACTQDDAGLLPEASEGIPMTFTATGLNSTAATTTGTRATVDGDWKGVTAVAIQIGNEVKEYRVTPSSDNLTATLSSDDPHYWAGGSSVTVSAWWPYTDGQVSMPTVTVKADQRGDGYAESDHIGVAEELLHYNGGTPTLVFTHRTARIVVTVSSGTSSISSVRLTNLSTANGNPGEIIAHDAGSGIYEALVAPQSMTAGTTFITCKFTNGKVFVYKMKNDTDWQAGKEYTYTVSLAAAKDPGYTVSEDGRTYEVYNAEGLKNIAKLVNEEGKTDINITLTGCYATGDVTVENDGTSYACAGGIVGMNGTGTLIACYAAGNVSGNIVGGAVGVNDATVTACYWSGLPDNDNGGATKVDGTNVTWQTAVDAMNAALQNAGSEWRYELTGALPTLKKQ